MRLPQNNDEDMFDPGPITDSARASYSEIVQRPPGAAADQLSPEEIRMMYRRRERIREQSPPPRYMPTPPHSFEDSPTTDDLAALGSTPPYGSAEYTSNFSPARFHRRAAQLQEVRARSDREMSTGAILDEVENARRATQQSLEEADRTIAAADRALSELPPLRRMGRRSHLPSPPEHRPSIERSRPTVDGLGDRSRSFSPEEDAWDTLLSTMTPDERVPSMHSSFTSATASASASASASSSLAANSATNSYGTLATTAPSSTSSMASADLYATMCDNSSSDDSLSDDSDMPEPPAAMTTPLPRSIYSRRYYSNSSGGSDRAEQLADQQQEEYRRQVLREVNLRTMRERERELEQIRAEREAELRRVQADLDRLERVSADRYLERRAGRERL